jgi:hypothetical protein
LGSDPDESVAGHELSEPRKSGSDPNFSQGL